MSTSKSAFSVSITDCGPLLNAALIFCLPEPGDVHLQVARERHRVAGLAVGVQDHHRVGARRPVGRRVLVGERLGFGFAGHERAGVGADDEEVGAVGRGRRGGQLDARDLADLVVDVAVDLEDGRSHHERAHHDGDDDPSGERAQRGEGRSHGPVMVPTGRRAGTRARPAPCAPVPWTGAPFRHRRVRADRADPAGCGGRGRAPGPLDGGRRRARRGGRGLRRRRVRGPRRPRARVLGRVVRVRARARRRAGGATRRVTRHRRRCPDAVFARFDAVAVVDEQGAVSVRGDGPGRDAARARASARADDRTSSPDPVASGGWHCESRPRASTATASRPSSSCCAPASATR